MEACSARWSISWILGGGLGCIVFHAINVENNRLAQTVTPPGWLSGFKLPGYTGESRGKGDGVIADPATRLAPSAKAGPLVTPLPAARTIGDWITAIIPDQAKNLVDYVMTAVGGSDRPSPRESEIAVGSDLGAGHTPQVSYKDGQQVPYGTPGSVRPDFVAEDGTLSFEVKNYNVATNSSGLINNVAQQAIQRATNLPEGMQQQVVIDVRGQTVTPQQEDAIIKGIVSKSGGAISPDAIEFKR